MSQITFVYMRKKYQKSIKNPNTLLSEEIKKLSYILEISIENLYCVYNGKSLNNARKKISDFKKMNIFIYIFNLKKIKVKKDEKLNNLLCPSCEKLVSITLNEGKITLKNCCNNHKLQNISISLFINLQANIKEKDNYCSICHNNLNYYNYFYICSCNNFICPLCIDEHNGKNENHYKIINYKKFLICEKHNTLFNSFCKLCNKNLCIKCEHEHLEHNKNIILFKEIIQNAKPINDIKNEIKIFKKNIDKYKDDFNKIREKNIEFENNINIKFNNYNLLYNIIKDLMKDLNSEENTYENLNTILNLNLKKYNKELFNSFENIKMKYTNLFEEEKKQKEIIFLYQNGKNKNNKIKIFGKKFISNNKDKCKIFMNEKEIELTDYCNVDPKFSNKNIIIKFMAKQTINDMSYMFYDCTSLIAIYNFSNFEMSNATNMSYMFYGCSSLKYLNDFLLLKNISPENISYMFFGCRNLIILPNITLWNLQNLKSQELIFGNINENIKEIYPNLLEYMNNEIDIIYKYDKNMNEIKLFGKTFVSNNKNNCILIINGEILDLCEYYKIKENKNKNLTIKLIEKNEIINMSYMFCECVSLLSVVNFSKWKANNLNNTSYMFYGCSSLIDISDISTLITYKVTDISYMFFGCISLKYLPDINKWNINNIKNKENILVNINEKTREKYYNKLRKFMNNEMEILYQLNENNFSDGYINLFGNNFVKNNKDNCLLIINNKLFNFMDKYYYNIQDNKTDDIIIVKLIETNKITDMSYMFYGSENLISIRNISNWDTINVTNMKSMFHLCTNLKSLDKISELRVDNVIDFSYMFCGCSSLTKLENISKWNTYKAIDISYLFIDCISLKILPDISKWNLKNIKNRKCIFSNNILLYTKTQNIRKEIFSFLSEKYILKIIIYHKQLQNLFEINIEKYKKISGKYKIGEKNGKGREYILNTNNLIFEGEYLNGKKNGKGREYNYNGKLKFEGEYLNGERNGKGKEYYNDKIKFEGEFLNGKRNGKGKEYYDDGKLQFEGEYLKGQRWNGKGYNKNDEIDFQIIDGNGEGKEYYDDGKLKFEGKYLNGKKKGKVKELNCYGELIFEGEYLDGKRNGKGKEYNLIGLIEFEGEYLNGERWNGKLKEYNLVGELENEVEYINGKKDGDGKEYYDNGNIEFEGEFLNGKRNGKGKEYYNSGELRFEGEYSNGLRNDNGKVYYKNGKLRFEGKYLNGKPNGKGKEYYKNGKLEFEGEYSNGQRWNGKINEYNDNGNIGFKGEYLNGKRNGKGKEYYYDGKLEFSGEYLNGQRNGEGKEYYNSGELKFEGKYLNNERWNGIGYNKNGEIGFKIKDGNGKGKEYNYNDILIFEGEYLNGKRNGEVKEYYNNGKLYFEGKYINGERNGKGKEYYYGNGKVQFIGEYKKNIKWVGLGKCYYKNGNLGFEIEYINGKKDGMGKEYYDDGKLRFEGKYLDGQRNGKGKEYFGDILEFEGEYLYGKRKGKGKEYNYDGKLRFEGEYSNDQRNGKGKEYYDGKLRFEGEYSNGKRNGGGKEYYYNSKLKFEGEYSNDKKWNGKGYNKNGISDFQIKDGIGEGKEYYDNGKLEFEGQYLKGKKNGKGKEYHDNGKLYFEGEYSDGRRWNGKVYNKYGEFHFQLKNGF